MPCGNNQPYSKKHAKNHVKKRNRIHNLKIEEKQPNDHTKLIAFENSIACKVKYKDISRVHSLYSQAKKKLIKSKFTNIFYN